MSGDAGSRRPGRNLSARIPSLDGLRAISILAVLFAHANGTRGFSVAPIVSILGDLGNLGVRCFFVISGFLITHLLIQELSATGRISLKGFYIRRTFRIFPAFYTFIVSVVLLSWLGIIAAKRADIVYAATYSINYVERKSWVVGHLWSLAVEEQFYLLWPICVVAFAMRRAKKVALVAMLTVPFLRIAAWYALPEFRGLITKAFPTICDTIATGCVLACFREQLWTDRRYRAFLGSRWFIIVPICVLVSNSLASHTRPDLLFGQSLRNVGIALCIDWCLRNSESLVARLLNARLLVWIGTLSYSLYLWQQIFLNRTSTAMFCVFPFNVVLAFLFASLSYYAVERPFLNARPRFFPQKHPRETLPESGASAGLVVAEATPAKD